MFTVKIIESQGHTVFECASYRFENGNPTPMPPPGTPFNQGPSWLQLHKEDGDVKHTIPVGECTIFVMNAAGKTIDTFYGRPDRSTPATS